MSDRTASRPARISRLAVVTVAVALVGVLGYRSLGISPVSAAPILSSPGTHHSTTHRSPGTVPGKTTTKTATAKVAKARSDQRRALGVAGGEIPDGVVTVFDDNYPAVANLDPALLTALRRAASAAASDGVTFYVNSGWRSAAYQQHLLDEAVAKYGSHEVAARWVATPTTSQHVSGHAVDIGRTDASTWLSRHGAAYGLCQIYRNEPWHYELNPDALVHGCPGMYADPTHDPRLNP